MNKHKIKQKFLFGLIATLGFAPSLISADTLNLSGINSNYLQQVSVTYLGNTQNEYAGGISGNLNGGLNQVFFCYDIAHSINVPAVYTVNLFGPTASFPSYLGLPNTFNLQVASSLISNANVASFSNVNQYSGLQLAIWSILYNWTPTSQSTSLNGANFSSAATGDLLNAAQGFLALAQSLVNNGTYTNTGNVLMLVNATDSSGNVVQTLGAEVNVPEPSTYLILGSTLFAIAVGARKRKTQISA